MFDELINSDRLYLVDDVGWQMVNPGKLPIRTRTLMVGPRSPFFFMALPGRYKLAVPFFGKSRCWSQYTREISLNIWTVRKWCLQLQRRIFGGVQAVGGDSIHENLRIPPPMPILPLKEGPDKVSSRTMMANNPLIRPDFFLEGGGIGGEVTFRFPWSGGDS